MAVFRVEKTKDFTIMSNHHLRNTELSLKAKGLLSLMLSLPEDWDYTTKGLAHICKDGVDSITTALKELERHGYLTRQRLRYDNGQLGDIEYTIHEQPVSTENTGLSPKRENPRQVKPEQAKPKQAEPEQENPAQLNTNPLKTKKSKKDKSITYPSIYPAEPEAANRTDGMDRIELIEAYREIIKENIEYDLLVLRYGRERLDETLELMHAVRYADDFKIFCATHEDAVRAYKATELWLKDRLGLEISPDKSKVVNLKRQNSDFLGFKLKVRKKGKKYVVRSHMSDKAYKKAHEKVSEEVKKLAHSSDDNAQFMQLQKYNSVVAGLHEYYCISTEVSHDFSRLAFSINKQLRNRLKGDLSKKGQLRNGFIKEKYGASRQMRFLHGRPVVPLGYVQSKNAQHKRKSINKYTVKGREQIHKNLAIDTATMLWLMRNPVKGRTIEYADNRISLYAAQYGKCAVTGIPMDSHDIHCHHKVPVSNGGSDEYANLILVSKAVHILIHASSELTIEKYLKSLNLDNKQIEKLNKLRIMAEMPPIIL